MSYHKLYMLGFVIAIPLLAYVPVFLIKVRNTRSKYFLAKISKRK